MLIYPLSTPNTLLRKKKPYRLFANILLIFLVSFIFVSSLFVLQIWFFFSKDLPETKAIVIAGEESSEVLDRDGNVLKILYLTERRIYVSLSDIAPYIIDAVVASEDERFYKHSGVDLKAVLRAVASNILSKDYAEGGSTITQQLARNVFLSKEKTIIRKVKEIIMSLRIEQRFTKTEILELYLNQAYFGEGCYGVETAARKYYGKHAKELNLEEASLLISILPAPSALSLFSSMQEVKDYQRNVLYKMTENHYITADQAEKAFHTEVVLSNQKAFSDNETILPDGLDYYIDYVKEEVVNKLSAQELYKGGLRIHTNLHPSIQRLCFQKFKEVLDQAEKDGKLPMDVKDQAGVVQPQGAVAAVSAKTGEVFAMVGGRDYNNTKFNRCLAERQSGSSFKVFPYVAAIDQGLLGPNSVLVSEAINVDGWRPKEWTSGFFGAMTVRRAMGISSNIAAVKVALKAGLEQTASYAQKMGLTTPMLAVPSMALGSLEVKPLDMAIANAVMANGGKYNEPSTIKLIERRKTSQKLYQFSSEQKQVISPQAAYLMVDLLMEPFKSSGTASALRIPGVPMAGKTGTTENFRDGWFVGFTPSIVLAVYVGADSKDIDLSAVQNYGSVFAGQIFKQIVQTLYQQKFFVDQDWKEPQGLVQVRICKETGLRANSTCSTIIDTRVESSILTTCLKKHALAPSADKEEKDKKETKDQTPPEKEKSQDTDPAKAPEKEAKAPAEEEAPPPPKKEDPDQSLYTPPSLDTGDFSVYFGSANLRIGSPTEIGFNIFDPRGNAIELYLNGQLVAILTEYPYRYYYVPDTPGVNLMQAILRSSSSDIIGNKIMNFYVFQ
jgi:penicillin-binding protein 1A